MDRPRVIRETKVKLSLTITPTQKNKLWEICEAKNVSASDYIGKWIEQEYKKLLREKEKGE